MSVLLKFIDLRSSGCCIFGRQNLARSRYRVGLTYFARPKAPDRHRARYLSRPVAELCYQILTFVFPIVRLIIIVWFLCYIIETRFDSIKQIWWNFLPEIAVNYFRKNSIIDNWHGIKCTSLVYFEVKYFSNSLSV